METVYTCFAFLAAVALSGLLARMLPSRLPQPVIQIALGAAIALVSGKSVELEPELFFLLFVPPLLFIAGWRIPKDRLRRDRNAILGLALGLVFLTVVGAGFFLHWMIPALPLGVAFATAAVVSPTDPIAVSAIAQEAPMPERMMNILEGESLLNDASGLVCLRFAVVAVLTGSFSLASASLEFLWVSVGGLATGAVLSWAIVRLQRLVARRVGEDAGPSILVTVLLPFAAYLAAERIGTSGILAAVAAGIMMTFSGAGMGSPAMIRLHGRAIWNMVDFTLNGVIFVLLGEQLPAILSKAPQTALQAGQHNPWMLAIYAVALMVALVSCRFGWAWLSLRWTLLRDQRYEQHKDGSHSPPLRIAAAMACAGARGAITLAGVLTLPFALPDGSLFPARDLAIFLAATVILLSLTLASIGLPWLLKGLRLPADDSAADAERSVRIAAARAAIERIERVQRDMTGASSDADACQEMAERAKNRYRSRIDALASNRKNSSNALETQQIERRMHQAAIQAERETIDEFLKQHSIDSALAHKLRRELDFADARADISE